MEKQGRKDWGIEPDVEVKLKTNELRKMIDVQNKNEVLVKADHDNDARPVKRYSIDKTLESDPQMAIGLLVLKSKLVRDGVSVQIKTAGNTVVNN